MKNTLILALLLFSNAIFSQEIDTENWTTDLNFLKTELAKKHKNLFHKLSKTEFENGIDKIIRHLDNDTDIETSIKLTQLIAKVGDSHTDIKISHLLKKSKSIPLNFYWFKDGYYVISTTKDNYEILDKKVIAINNFKTEQIIDSLKTLFVAENNALIHTNVARMLDNDVILKYFGFANPNDTSYTYEVVDANGIITKQTIHEEDSSFRNNKNKIITKVNTEKPFYNNNSVKIFKEEYFPNDKIYFVQYNKCVSKETIEKYGDKDTADNYPSFNEFEKTVLDKIENLDIDKLIFDIRFNPGGSSYLAEHLIDKIASNKKLNQKGKLFLVIGNKTFSSAIFNAIYFKEKTKAILIGEETGGKPNHYGYIKSFTLPYSTINVTYSSEFWKLIDEDTTTITPDVLIECSINDFKNGIDPVFEFVKQYK